MSVEGLGNLDCNECFVISACSFLLFAYVTYVIVLSVCCRALFGVSSSSVLIVFVNTCALVVIVCGVKT